MATRYAIHPSLGVARLGDSERSFYLAPEEIGGLPLECDDGGNPVIVDGRPQLVKRFKDDERRVRRQAARFKLFAYEGDDDAGREVTLADDEILSIQWTVHLANKKPVWRQGGQFDGNPMLGEWDGTANSNSYDAKDVPWRNATIEGESERRKRLIIDPGPRTVDKPGQRAAFSRDTVPDGYSYGSFPPEKLRPYRIDSLGELVMDSEGRLVALGGFGRSCGDSIISTFTGGEGWYDDISDGPVTCILKTTSGEYELQAWLLVAPPKYAPELTNIVTLDDVMADVGVRYMGLMPDLYDEARWSGSGGWNPDYEASFERDIRPIIERPADYLWVANVPSMMAFSAPKFDPRDASEANRANREGFFRYFRDPGDNELSLGHQTLMSSEGIPLMPLNAGSNPVTNSNVDKFMSLTQTQYRLLQQWARGRFTVEAQPPRLPGVHPLDQASWGNCAGHPMSPGWEVSWNTRNPTLYERPYAIKHRYADSHYWENGLSVSYDECMPNPDLEFEGLEPGDLTKRMSAPWQADFYQCAIEYTNFDRLGYNQDDETQIPPPPTYYSFWWPPQAPVYVMAGEMTAEGQKEAGVPPGYQVYFARGANNIARLVLAWKYMGFVTNQNTAEDARRYPYFVEVERNHDEFEVASVAVGQAINQLAASGSYFTEDNYFVPTWYLKDDEGIGGPRRP